MGCTEVNENIYLGTSQTKEKSTDKILYTQHITHTHQYAIHRQIQRLIVTSTKNTLKSKKIYINVW